MTLLSTNLNIFEGANIFYRPMILDLLSNEMVWKNQWNSNWNWNYIATLYEFGLHCDLFQMVGALIRINDFKGYEIMSATIIQ